MPILKTDSASIKQICTFRSIIKFIVPYIMDQNLTLQAKKFYIIGPWDYTGSPEATNLLRTTQLFNCQEAPDASKNCINIR